MKLCCQVNPSMTLSGKHYNRCSICRCKLCNDCLVSFQIFISPEETSRGKFYHCEECYYDELAGDTKYIGFEMWLTTDADDAARMIAWYNEYEEE